VIRHPDEGLARISTALASPTHYFEMQFQAVAGTPYRIWLRGRADNDHWANDSVHVQFSGSVTKSGSATWRIGTTSSTEINLEECSGCGLTGWMWQDNGWGGVGVLGPEIYFATTGTQTIRVQTREDGLAIDRIVLSPSTYLTTSPGATTSTSPTSSTSSPSGSALRVFHWNIQHGTTDAKVYDLDLQASWIAKSDPHVVSLNEVERFTHWGNEDQPKRFAELLKQKTGKTWYYHFATRNGATNAQGNLLLSVYPIESTGSLLLSHNRSVAQIRITVNGRSVSVFSTHLDHESSSRRATQMEELKKWAAGFPEQRIIAGDFNTWPSAGEITRMTGTHFDVWAEAAKAGTAVSFPGNDGQTRNTRIDYIFLSHGATRTTIKGAQVIDTRDKNGVMASDHRPLVGFFEVK
jgi:endonuclease/exonuclease/phosphatase family metal-dependent hydrolase